MSEEFQVGLYTDVIKSLDEIRAAKPKMIFYGMGTCWWTHDSTHLCMKPGTSIPCDPRGGVLFQTDDIEGFLKSAEESATHYGKHGIRAFLAAHHVNCVVSAENPLSTCFAKWDDYNRILDKFDAAAAVNSIPEKT